jgi:hypothetical protein
MLIVGFRVHETEFWSLVHWAADQQKQEPSQKTNKSEGSKTNRNKAEKIYKGKAKNGKNPCCVNSRSRSPRCLNAARPIDVKTQADQFSYPCQTSLKFYNHALTLNGLFDVFSVTKGSDHS